MIRLQGKLPHPQPIRSPPPNLWERLPAAMTGAPKSESPRTKLKPPIPTRPPVNRQPETVTPAPEALEPETGNRFHRRRMRLPRRTSANKKNNA